MKKFLNLLCLLLKQHRKKLIVMRNTLLILIISTFQVFATDGYAQTKKINLEMKNASIKEVLFAIEEQSEFYFLFNSELIDVAKKVDIKIEEEKVDAILARLFSKEEVDFLIKDRYIILTPVDGEKESFLAQQPAVSGTVTDEVGQPLPGVTVVVKGTTQGTVTNADGEYSLTNIPEDATLQFSFVGMVTQEMEVGNQSQIDVTMVVDAIGIEEVVAVGYGTRKKESLTGAISNIVAKDIRTTTNPSLAQSLQGKIAGMQIRQNTGEPGDFNTMINIRGFGAPLYVIDGVARDGGNDFQRLNPNDIESISILKDASAAIYGLNAANGVIIVTTKKGAKGKTKFNYNGVTGLQMPTDVPAMANASQWLEMRNDADINVGLGPYISIEELQKYQQGLPGYESTNWFDQTMKKYSNLHQHNLSAQGGNEAMSYFVSFGYLNEGGLLKTNDLNYEKFTIRSNLTMNLTKNLTADVNLHGRFDKKEAPGMWFFEIFKGTRVTLPNEKVYANDNPLYPNMVGPSNINPVALANRDITGFSESKHKFFQSSFSMTYNFPGIEGLKIKGLAAYDSDNFLGKNLARSYKLYRYDEFAESYSVLEQRSPSSISNDYGDENRLTLQAHLLYDLNLSDAHNLGITLVYEQKKYWQRYAGLRREYDFFTNDQIDQASLNNQQTSGSEMEMANMSYIGRINYDYKGKYLIEFASRYDGSYRYHPDQRWGFFPVVSGGWRISEENFIKEKLPFISNLKLRGSYGIVGEDAGAPFQYVQGFSTSGGGGYEFINGTWMMGASSPAIVNEKLTWYESNIKNIGMDLSLLQSLLAIEFDIYQRDRTGLLAYRNVSLPNTFGGTLPQENLNSDRVRGIEFSIAHNRKIGNFSYGIKGNFNYARTMNVYVERGPFQSSFDKWRNGAANRWSDIGWGYVYEGQFQNIDEIANAPIQNGNLGNTLELPGDFKYEDVNGDGLINDQDILPLFWTGNPKLYYGATFTANWKGFDIVALLQGSGKYTLRFNEVYAQVMAFRGNTPEYFYDRWHLADQYDPNSEWIPGEWPATRFIQFVGAMYNESEKWRRDASYIRLKSLEVGYTFNMDILRKVGIDNLRIYTNGHNLLTIADPFVKPFDPEKIEGAYQAGLTYPLMRSFNLGVDINF